MLLSPTAWEITNTLKRKWKGPNPAGNAIEELRISWQPAFGSSAACQANGPVLDGAAVSTSIKGIPKGGPPMTVPTWTRRTRQPCPPPNNASARC